MRSFTLTNTISTVFGNVQDRFVTANREGRAPAMPHLMSHDWRGNHASPERTVAKALKRLVAVAVTGAARLLGKYSPSIAKPQLCRLPVLSARQRPSVQS